MIEITVNQWRVPSIETAFDNWLEGVPTPSQRASILADVAVKRAAWKPSVEGMQQLEQLQEFIGGRVRIQLWDSCMFLLPDEGPFPIKGKLVGVVMKDVDGYPQPFLQLLAMTVQANDSGYAPDGYITHEDGLSLVPVADLYTLTKLGDCHVST